MRCIGIATVVLAACGGTAEPVAALPTCDTVDTLFGAPNANTGLGSDACGPTCACGDSVWEAPVYTADDVAALRSWTVQDPSAVPTSDAYDAPAPAVPEGSVCGVVVVDPGARTYALETFASREAAEAAGAQVTHGGVCGLCSTLEDLAVYIEQPDLTEPVRACGVRALVGSEQDNRDCLLDLGFTPACAEIWLQNTTHTRERCQQICLALFDAPYLEADGALNACLQCDEDESGPVFKAVSGRTRRNSGLATALCRPCAEVLRVVHRYGPDASSGAP